MFNMFTTLAVLLTISASGCTPESENFLKLREPKSPSTVPLAVKAKLSKGVNFSLWFAQREDYPWSMLMTRVTPQDIAAVKVAGFKHIRIPVEPESLEWNPKTRKFSTTKLAFFRQNIDEMRRIGLYVIVDFHPNPDKQVRLSTTASYRDEIKNFWIDLIKVLKDIPSEQIGFEAYNEPIFNNQVLWRSYQEELLTSMRAEVPEHTLFATAEPWGSLGPLTQFAPYSDKNIMYVFHYYEPMVVSHQGAKWTEMTKDIKGLQYPFNQKNFDTVLAQQTNPDTRYMLQDFGKKKWNSSMIDADMKRIRNWANRNSVDIICTEFGCVEKTDTVSRANLITDIRKALDRNMIPWSFWDYNSQMGISREPSYYKNISPKMLQYLGMPRSKYNP